MADAEHDERRGTAAERGYDARWVKLRLLHLQGEPLCRRCHDAKTAEDLARRRQATR